jgi:RNA polymerase sigma factor (sigma-70 family)
LVVRPPPDDTELVARALARDAAGREAFGVLVARHQPLLDRTVLRAVGGDRALAADATQDAVLQALVGLGGLREPSAFGAWLTGIGLRVARRLVLRRARDAPLEDDAPAGADPARDAERADLAARVRAAVAALPPGQRDAVFLYYLAGLSQGEVAQHLGTAEGAVRTRLHKARAALREQLHDERTDMKDIALRVADVRPTQDDRFSATHVVVLEAEDGRTLPIWIDTAEAVALVAMLEAVALPRPGTYAFAAALVGAAGTTVASVRIAELDANAVFFAVVTLGNGATLDARPSDALNLALLAGAPISVAPAVLDAADPDPGGSAERGAPAMAAALRERLA